MIHIGIDIHSTVHLPTGVGNYTYNLVRALTEVDQKNVYTLFLFDARRRYKDGTLEKQNVTLQKIRIPGRIVRKTWDLFGRPFLDSLTGPHDLFHFPNYVLPPLRSGKTLVTIHDVSFLRHPNYTRPETLGWLFKHIHHSVRDADAIVTDSLFSRSEIMECLDIEEGKIHVVYPGVARTFMSDKDPEMINRVKAKYRLPDRYLLHVGTLEPRKNLPNLLKAFERNKHFFQKVGCKLVLVGMKGWMYDDIFETMRRYALEEDVILTGYAAREDLPFIYQGSQLFVFPSFYEGFGIPPLEAMASSVPVIASDTGSHREVLKDAALYVTPHDVDGMARVMREAYEDEELRSRLMAKGLRRASLFSWQASASRLVGIYEQCAHQSR